MNIVRIMMVNNEKRQKKKLISIKGKRKPTRALLEQLYFVYMLVCFACIGYGPTSLMVHNNNKKQKLERDKFDMVMCPSAIEVWMATAHQCNVI